MLLQSHPNRCKFFKWADELGPGGGAGGQGGGGQGAGAGGTTGNCYLCQQPGMLAAGMQFEGW